MRRITVDPNANDARVRNYTDVIENARLCKVDFSKVATEQSSSVSSVAWSSVGRNTCTIAGEALGSNIASAYLSASYSGQAKAKVQATLASGYTSTVFIEIRYTDPGVTS